MSRNNVNGRTIKRAALIFLPLAVAVLGVTYLLYASQASAIRSIAHSTEDRALDIARQRVTLVISPIVNDARYLAELDALQTVLADGGADALFRLGAEYRAFARHRELFDQIRLLDMAGQEVVRVDRRNGAVELASPRELQNRSTTADAQAALKLDRGQAFISQIELNTEAGVIEQPPKPIIRVGVPVLDSYGNKRGAVIVSYLAKRLLERIDDLKANVAGMWLLNSDGYWLLGPNAEDAFAFMYPDRHDRSFAKAYANIWRQMQALPLSGRLTDETGQFNYVRTDPLPDATASAVATTLPHWYALIYTPSAFSAARTSDLRREFAAAAAALLVLVAGISAGMAKYQIHRRQSEQHIRFSEARFRAVTETASDAVISADRSGTISYFNPGAEGIFGYTSQEAVGQPLTLLMPERFHRAHTEGLRRYLATRDAKVVGRTVELVGGVGMGRSFQSTWPWPVPRSAMISSSPPSFAISPPGQRRNEVCERARQSSAICSNLRRMPS